MTDVVLIKGDGIGPEVVDATVRTLKAFDTGLTFSEAVMGESAIEKRGEPLPDETIEAVKSAGLALKGPVTTPIGSGFRSVNVALRRVLNLHANIRPCRFTDGVASRITDPQDIDTVIVRENLEDLYMGVEFEAGTEDAELLHAFLSDRGRPTPQDSAYSIKPISQQGTEKIVRTAFDYAVEHGREKVTAVDKANIMKATDGLFMHTAERIAEEYGIEYDHVLVDNMAQQLVMHPQDFDVIVTQNIYGDILSDLAAGLVGGVGLIPSANIGDDAAVFASVHGSAPDIAGQDKANPAALMRSAAMLLRHVGAEDNAETLEAAINHVIANGPRTADLGGDASTTEFTDAVIDAL